MFSLLHVFDLVGVFMCAMYGAYVGQKKGLDIFGILVCGAMTAVGGGTIREILLNHLPYYLFDYVSVLVILLGVAASIFVYRWFEKIQFGMLIIDALGLTTFAYLGAASAAHAHLGLVGIVLFATISAVGGGIMRDVLVKEIPMIFYQDFYATPAIILGFIFALTYPAVERPVVAYSLIVGIFCLRVLAIHFRISLWKRKNAEA